MRPSTNIQPPADPTGYFADGDTENDAPSLITELMRAARAGSAEGIARALSEGDDPNKKGPWGNTALMIAVDGEALQAARCVKTLLQVSDATIANDNGETPLMAAAEKGSKMLVKMLLPKSNPTQKNGVGNSALFYAANRGHTTCVAELLPFMLAGERGAKGATALMAYAASAAGQSPCSTAALECLDALIAACGAQSVGDGKADALMMACSTGNEEFAKRLIPLSNLSQTTAAGHSALHFAAFSGQENCARLLLAACPSLIDQPMNAVDTTALEFVWKQPGRDEGRKMTPFLAERSSDETLGRFLAHAARDDSPEWAAIEALALQREMARATPNNALAALRRAPISL